jgi:hypothetical protein
MNPLQERQLHSQESYATLEAVTAQNIMRSFTKTGRWPWYLRISLVLVIVGISLYTVASMAQEEAVVIIANVAMPDRSLSKTEVQNIFLGKLTKVDGTKITFVILKTGDIHAEFLETYLSRTPSQYTKYWKKLVFSGKGRSPKAFDSEEDLIAYVEQTQGAIGYIAASTAQSLQNEHIRNVTVQ